MDKRRLLRRYRPSALAPTAAEAAAAILRRPASSQRIASYGEIREYEARQRWLWRRVLVIGVLLVGGYVISTELNLAILRQMPSQISPEWEAAAKLGARPLQFVRFHLGVFPVRAMFYIVDRTCDAVVTWMFSGQSLLPAWSANVGLVAMLLAGGFYCLSPAPCWWVFRFIAVEIHGWAYAFMEVAYQPLLWLSDRSQTVREFYENYYDAVEWVD